MGVLVFLNICCVLVLFFSLFEAMCFLSFWFILELLSLSIIPHFFMWSSGLCQRSLMQYVIILMVSSLFLVMGVLVVDFRSFFICLGVLMKLGVFPFMFWLYEVVCYSNWVVVWLISGILKVPLFLLFYVRGVLDDCLFVLCVLSFLVLSVNFWKVTLDWRYCWCHMMLSGSSGLVVVFLCCPLSVALGVFFVYLLWCTLVLWYFSFYGLGSLSGLSSAFFIFLLISFPVSLAVVYKLVFCLSILFSSFFVFIFWCVYTISEQLYLLFFYASSVKIRSVVPLLSSV